MTTPKPDERAATTDPRVAAAWDAASREEPPAALDAAILAAARREVGAGPQGHLARDTLHARRRWWPLAAAAAVAAIAVGLLQLTTPDQLGAPAPGTTAVTDMPAPAAKITSGEAGLARREDATREPAPVEPAAPGRDGRRTPAAPSAAPATKNREVPTPPAAPRPGPFPAGPQKDGAPSGSVGKPLPGPAGGGAMTAQEQRQPPRPPANAGTDSAAATTTSAGTAPAPTPATAAQSALAPRAAPSPASPPMTSRTPAAPTAPTASTAPAPAASEGVAPQRAATAKVAAGSAADNRAEEALARERAPLPVAEWIALIRRLRAEGKTADAARELAAFRAAHADHERRLPPDLRDWRPQEK